MGESVRRHWTAGDRAKFLEILGRDGTVKGACAAVGFSVAGAQYQRKRDPEFARAWDEVKGRVAEVWALARIEVTVKRVGLMRGYRLRHDGWTGARQQMFLRALAETGCVRDACMRAQISNASAYRLRKSNPDFARAWTRALAKAVPTLEHAAYTRAVTGWDEPVWYQGQVVGHRKRYSDALLGLLLRRGDMNGASIRAIDPRVLQAELVAKAREAAQAAGGTFETIATSEETDRQILKQLEAIDRHRRAQGLPTREQEAAERRLAALGYDLDGDDDDDDDDDGDGAEDDGDDLMTEE